MSPLLDTAVSFRVEALCAVTGKLPVGTNLGLLHFMWMQVSGSLLPGRGGLFPALQATGLLPPAVRRAWAAFRYGAWDIADLLSSWEEYVVAQGQWQEHRHGGYRPKAVDLTAYRRPTVRGLKTKHYYPPAGKLPAVVLGIIARVGSVNGQRVAVITDLVRADAADPSAAALQTRVLLRAAQMLDEDEIPVFDAGFKVRAYLQIWGVQAILQFLCHELHEFH